MPLPDGGPKTPWPPTDELPALRLTREWAAWWSGDPARLMEVYGTTVGGQATAVARPNWFRRFWERISGTGFGGRPADRHRAYLHVPLAGDISSTSASLLFSEPATLQIAEAHGERASADAKAAEAELERIRTEGDLDSRFLEAADIAAGLGGVFWKPTWDMDLADHPLLSVVQPDQVLPEFRHGILVAATLWRDVERTDRDVIRHLERHEVAAGRTFTLHALFRGTPDELGDRMPDAELVERTRLDPVVELPFPGLGIHYVANRRPSRRLRGSWLGESDYAGAEGLLDALDEAWASWMRDIRLAKARILVARDMLDRSGRFDVDHEVYSPLDIGNATAGTPLKDQISSEQPEIRFEAHSQTCLSLVERIVDHGGYAPQTFGLRIEGRAESGTALNIRERKTFLTQQKKSAAFGSTIERTSEQMLWVSRAVFGVRVTPVRPSAELADAIAADDRQVAETIEILNRAEAVSAQTKVEMAHPDWEPAQVQAEAKRILDERGLSVPAPDELGGLPVPPG